jgi:Tfp pilus assembly pilus retraction ATPase PilT
MFDLIKTFYQRPIGKGAYDEKKPLGLVITGEIGSGKSHCIRALVEKI